jgi:uncharacterized cupin superfamily protein
MRLRDEQHRPVAVADERIDQELQSDRECERLVRVLATEGHKLVFGRRAGDHVTVGHTSHGDVADDRPAVGARDGDSKRVRPCELRPTLWMAEARRRRRGQHGQEPALGEPPRPVAEHPSGKAVVRDDEPCGLGRILELAAADRRESQVAERTAALPPLVAPFGLHALRLGRGVEALQRLEPGHARKTVPSLPARLGVEEVVGKGAGVLFRETECADPLLDLHGGEHTYDVVSEAKLENGVPQSAGWFVVNARDGRWVHNEMGDYCGFEGKDEAAFEQLGINLNVLPPGMPMAMYHEEPGQEDFLVLRGECLLIVEGEERPLKAWDFVHCPPQTKHVILGAGDEPALVLAVGARKGQASYPVDETAIRHGAGVDQESASPKEAYARFGPLEDGPAPELSL